MQPIILGKGLLVLSRLVMLMIFVLRAVLNLSFRRKGIIEPLKRKNYLSAPVKMCMTQKITGKSCMCLVWNNEKDSRLSKICYMIYTFTDLFWNPILLKYLTANKAVRGGNMQAPCTWKISQLPCVCGWQLSFINVIGSNSQALKLNFTADLHIFLMGSLHLSV